MKKLLIITILTIASLTLEAMQQAGQQVQEKVPKLQALISPSLIKNIIQGTVDPKQLSEVLKTLPDPEEPGIILSEATKKALQDLKFLISFDQAKAESQINALVGIIKQFPNKSMRIDNYLGIGDTLFLSGDLQHYIHVNSQGNIVINSSNKELIESKEASNMFDNPTDYYQFSQGIESHYSPYHVINSDADKEKGPFLTIRYPQDLEVEFKAGSNYITANSRILSPHSGIILTKVTRFNNAVANPIALLLSLHRAITNLDRQVVKQIIDTIRIDLRNKKKVLDYILVTDNALHRAIKQGLTATGQQLEDTKAIIYMLLAAGADLEQQNSAGQTALQLAAHNPEIMATIQQAYARTILFNAISSADQNQVNQVITVITKQGYAVPEFLNTSYGTDTPLVHTLTRALETTDKQEFDRYIAIARLLINSGATFNNPSGDSFLKVYGKQYVEKIAHILK